MQAGLYWSADDFRLKVSVDMTTFDTYAFGEASGSVHTQWTPNTSTVLTGIRMGAGRTYDPIFGITQEAVLTASELGISDSVTIGDSSDLEFRCSVKVWRLADMSWQTDFENCAWWVNGSLHATYAAVSVVGTPDFLAPSAIPVIGIPATVQASGSFNPQPGFALDLSLDVVDAGGECTATGGWSHDGVTHACAISALDGIDTDCCGATLDLPSITASNTGEVTVYGEGRWVQTPIFMFTQTVDQGGFEAQALIQDIYSVTNTITAQASEAMALPNLAQGIVKLNGDDYSALIGRAELPRSRHIESGWCTDEPFEFDTPEPEVEYMEVHPNQAPIVAHVRGTTHAMEDTFGYGMLAPYTISSSKQERDGIYVDVIQPGIFAEPIPPNPPLSEVPIENSSDFCAKSKGASFPVMDSGDCAPMYDHDASHVAKYLNTWGCRLGSFYYHFPVEWDGEGTPPANLWPVQTLNANPSEYWQPLRSQWMGDSFLDEDDRTSTRNSIVAAGLCEDRAYDWCEYIAGRPASLWGISRFHVDSTEPLESYQWTEDVTGGITGEDCTLSFGASVIEATPTAATIEVRVELGDFVQEPFMFPHLCNRFKASWDTTTCISGAVYVENLEGERALLGSAPVTDWTVPASFADEKFAGSWAQDFGQGVAADTGVDIAANGESLARMGDAEGAMAFQLHGGRTWKRLVYVFETDGSTVVDVNYPSVATAEGKTGNPNAKIVHEQGHHANLLFANGPGVRYGAWNWLITFPFTDLLTTPNALPPGTAPLGRKHSIVDAGCWRNAVLLGKDREDGLRTWIRDRYSLFELVGTVTVDGSVSDNQVYREADEFCISFPLVGPKAGAQALVNTCAEFAPCVMFPSNEYDQETWTRDVGWSARAYALDQGPRRYVSTGKPFTLVPDGGSDILSASGLLSLSGWIIREHMVAVTNNEEVSDWALIIDGATLAEMTPWHGYLWIQGRLPSGALHTTNILLPWGGLVVAWSDGEGIMVKRSNYPVPISYDSSVRMSSNPDDIQPRLRVERHIGRLHMVWMRSLSMYEAYSDDDGLTWSTPSSVVSDVKWADTWSDLNGFEGVATWEYESGSSGPGNIKLKVRDPGSASFGSWITVSISGTPVSFADSTFKFTPSQDAQGTWTLSATKDGDLEPTNFASHDEGATWAEI